jgi:archaellum biogenesis ATPase FlaH
MNVERVILSNLLYNEAFTRKTLPYLKSEYFSDRGERAVFDLIREYVDEYNALPTSATLALDLSSSDKLDETTFREAGAVMGLLEPDRDAKLEWLLDRTEEFCKDRALYLAIKRSISIIDGGVQSETLSRGSIPQLLTDALGVSFDDHVGHDFLADTEERFDFYRRRERRIPFSIAKFNEITGGGLPPKTLNVALAGTGVGKSLFMCHCAATNLRDGYNVLYITLEMAEERIAERVDANLLDVSVPDLSLITRAEYVRRMDRLRSTVKGRLIIKEYPTACAGAANFRHLLNELKLKKNFVPDIIYVDYLNICTSSRIKFGASVNSYTYVKSIAEEIRGLAVEFDLPIVTATQTTRSGYSNSDPGLSDTSESFGLPATADLMFAIIGCSEELESLNQWVIKQLKNRYNDLNACKRFIVGVDRPKMRVYDVDDPTAGLIDDIPVFDHSSFDARRREAMDFK